MINEGDILKNILVYPCGTEIGLEIFRALNNSIHYNLVGGSSSYDHGRFVYKNHIDHLPFLTDYSSEQEVIDFNKKIKKYHIDMIYPAMDGYVYFLELGSGAATRDPLYLGIVTKGTAALDPRGYPLLYTGQGIPATQDGVFGSWFRIISLIENKVIWSFGNVLCAGDTLEMKKENTL